MARRGVFRRRPWQRLVAIFLVLGLLPLAVLTFSVLNLSQHAVTSEVDARLKSSAQTITAFGANAISQVSTALQTFSSQTGLGPEITRGNSADVEHLESQSAQLIFTRPDLSAVLLLNTSGRVLAGDPAANWEGRDLGRLGWVSESLRTSKTVVSNAFISTYDGLRVLAISTPIGDFGPTGHWQVSGLVVGIYSLQALQGALDAESAKDDMSVYIVDRADMQIVGPDLGSSTLVPAPRGVSSTARPLSGTTVENGNGSMLLTHIRLPDLGWQVVAQVPTARAFAGLRRMRALVISIAVLLAGVLLFGLWFMLHIDRRRSLLEEKADRQSSELEATEQLFRSAFVHAPAGMAWVNEQGVVSEANLAMHEMLGYSPDTLSGRSLLDLTFPGDEMVLADMDAQSEPASAARTQLEVRYVRGDSTVIWTLMSKTRVTDVAGSRFGLIQVVDITERKAAESLLSDQAMHDPLTGLPNRALLESRISRAMARAGTGDDPGLALMFIDLDGFKEINDRLGHRAGDEVLMETAARLERSIRSGDTVARLGGDEFVVLCEGISADAVDRAYQLGLRLLETISQVGTYRGQPWQVGASIGISRARPDSRNIETLMTEADSAMYRAKQQGKGCVEFYEPSLDVHFAESPVSEAYLATAIEHDRLQLRYQPVVDLRTGAIVGAETLLRLLGPHGDELAPADFLPMAEAHGHIVAYGQSTLLKACRQAAVWKCGLSEHHPFRIAVNMSVREIEDPAFLSHVDAALDDSGLSADNLVIELTESAFLRDLPVGKVALQGLRDRGVVLALDDFGTGFSSLSYLRRFPVDIIKIDKSFVADLVLPVEHGVRVTEAIVALAHALQITLVAEGVETVEQRQKLVELECEFAQGYLLGRPMRAGDFYTELLVNAESSASDTFSGLLTISSG